MKFLASFLLLYVCLLPFILCQDGQKDETVYMVPPVEVNGLRIPRMGFGTAGLRDRTEGAVRVALESGYTMLDTAAAEEWYREEDVGNALRDVHPQNRPFLITKIHPRSFNHENGTARQVLQSVISLKINPPIDVVLLHAPECAPGWCKKGEYGGKWQDAWKELEMSQRMGSAKAIGVSNFNANQIRELLAMATVPVSVVQNHFDLFKHDNEVRALCKEHGIAYIGYSIMGTQHMRLRSDPNPVLSHKLVKALAQMHGASPARVVLSWAMQRHDVIAIPRSSNHHHIRDNALLIAEDGVSVKGFLSEGELDMLDGIEMLQRASRSSSEL